MSDQPPIVEVNSDPTAPIESSPEARTPNARVAELYGLSPEVFQSPETRLIGVGLCPFRQTKCDVSANRNRVATLNYNYDGVSADAEALRAIYGEGLPLGICSCWARRRNEAFERPWILCPKRLLAFEPPHPVIPTEVRELIQIENGRRVGVWPELKFWVNENDQPSCRFFEYTFDYLLMELDDEGSPIGPPYIIEIMTSSTRGGGLSEHMADVLMGRPQRHLGGVVDSIYTPNYRQVFERMLGQFIAKSEIAEHWGGKTIWVFQDVLLDYIEQTTAFNSEALTATDTPNVFCEVYGLERPANEAAGGLHLVHQKSLRGRARLRSDSADYTGFLGVGYAPPVETLRHTLKRGSKRAQAPKKRKANGAGFFVFTWGDDIDPRTSEPRVTPQTS